MAVVNAVMNFRVPYNVANILNSRGTPVCFEGPYNVQLIMYRVGWLVGWWSGTFKVLRNNIILY
jgi:hypothetical protein